MSNPLYGFIIFAFSCALSVSAAELRVLSSRETLFQCQPGSVLAKDSALADLYVQVLRTFTFLQGTAEITRELRALADWACLKKGKAPAKFHMRLKNLAKKVNASEWLTDDEKALFGDVCRRLRKKKRQLVVPVVIASLVVVAAFAGGYALKKNTRPLPGRGAAPAPADSNGSVPGGNPQQTGPLRVLPTAPPLGMRPNDVAALAAGRAVPTLAPGYGPHTPSAPPPLEH